MALDGLRDVLVANGCGFVHVSDYLSLERTLVSDIRINFVIIDLDSHESVAAQFDDLSRLRINHSDRSVILLSEQFETDEFGSYRRMLGDISLRMPVLHASIEIALLQAPINNRKWRKHLDDKCVTAPLYGVDHAERLAVSHS